jgi:hypothetical protein
MISELLEANLLDGLELSVTPETGGEGFIDWKELIARFDSYEITEDDGTKTIVKNSEIDNLGTVLTRSSGNTY